jgi:tetratricopeptide (TPR) repeat protein
MGAKQLINHEDFISADVHIRLVNRVSETVIDSKIKTIGNTRAIQIKTQPSDYLKLISQGKELLENNQLDDAMTVFELAMHQGSKPGLACFYEGLVNFKKEFLDGSQTSYEKGLSFNKIHYKCLVALFDLFMSLHKYEAAYEIVQKIVRFFPANPKRFSVQSEEDPIFAVAAFMVGTKEAKPDLLASRGLEPLKRGLTEIEVYRVTIDALEKLGQRDRAVEIREEAVKLYPELNQEIENAA